MPVLSSPEKKTMVRILWGATDFGTLLLKRSLENQVNTVWRRTSGEDQPWPYWKLQETDRELARTRVRDFFGLLDGAPPPKRVSLSPPRRPSSVPLLPSPRVCTLLDCAKKKKN